MMNNPGARSATMALAAVALLHFTLAQATESPPSGVQNLTLSGCHSFAPNWALTCDLFNQEQGTLYRRRGLRLGIHHSF